MYEDYEKLDFVDLMSERHSHLRGIVEDLTNQEITDSKLSSSEWYVIFRIYKKQLSFVELNQSVNLSRQAIHKVVNKLQDKEIAVIKDVEGNKKEKSVQLTKYGEKCYEQYLKINQQLESHIEKQLGTENMKTLKKLLSEDWNLKEFKNN
ncbi:MarR family winged helix-turn-helix transcriptional regulator [Staphylococcus pasteuri]|uniref:MarR family winged helix-turn-helix transcriptional regulator n=1 Tax=Staphylococcus pasteuri TaxID=45972 RepID=UPI000E3AE8FB|nr:MarR family winged helix-turn-helix transcriptional regulator [Staphylococcus pasteuri]RFD73803.1 hypothetical protein A7974_09765 [Staphylococcus pasteuri]